MNFVRFSEPQPRRRSLRAPFGARALASGALALLAIALGLVSVGRPLLDSTAAESKPQIREFTLTASEFDWEIMPGTTVRAWGYNGQVPGPEIRVNEGDTVRITLQNRLPVGTTIHWHGITNTPEMDGPAGLNQAPVEPGKDFVYEFKADPAGSRMYHAHTDVATQIALGLYGPLIVEPKKQTRHYDREYTYMLSEWDLEMTPDVATGKAPRGPRDQTLDGGALGTDLFLMNGSAFGNIPPVTLAEGDRVLIRLMNMGSLAHPIHTHGHSFKVVATDGNPVPPAAQLTKDTILVAPGERYDLELIGDNPGVWMFHCHIESHAANGMMSLIAYEGAKPTGPLAAVYGTDADPMANPASDPSAVMGHAHGASATTSTTTTTTSDPSAGLPAVTTGSAPLTTVTETKPADTPPPADGPVAEVAMRDDRFDPGSFTVAPGTTVTWVNKGANTHSVAAMGGAFQSVSLKPGESFSYRFDEAGTYQYMCKQHGRQGMWGTITVQ